MIIEKMLLVVTLWNKSSNQGNKTFFWKTRVFKPPCSSWWTKPRTKDCLLWRGFRSVLSSSARSEIPCALRSHRVYRGRWLPPWEPSPSNTSRSRARAHAACSAAGLVLVGLDRIVSSSGKPFFTGAVGGGGFHLNASQLLLKQKANPSFTSGSSFRHCCVF